MQVSAFKLLSKRELTRIQADLDTLLKRWAQSWYVTIDSGIDVSLDSCEQFRVKDLPHSDAAWFVTSVGDDSWVAVAPQDDSVNAIQGLLGEDFTDADDIRDNGSILASELDETLLYDLVDNVLQQAMRNAGRHDNPHHTKRPLAQPVWRYGSAAVCARITVGGKNTYLVMSPELVNCFLPSRVPTHKELGPLTRVTTAIEPTMVKLEITAGNAVLNIAELRGIAVGDIVRLDTKLDQPLSVMFGGKRLCSAFLGTQEGSKAVMLMSSHEVEV